MQHFSEGDQVRIDIHDKTDPDHDRYHGAHGIIVGTLEDDASAVTGNDREGVIYRVELDTDETADFRVRDLRPPLE